MVAGDVTRTFKFRKKTVPSKTNTTVTKGDVLVYDTDGWAPGTQVLAKASTSARYKKYVATETVAAVTSTQNDLPVLAEGLVGISKISGALEAGQLAGLSTTPGSVQAWTPPNLSVVAYCATTVQAELEKLGYIVGEVDEDAGSSDAYANVWI